MSISDVRRLVDEYALPFEKQLGVGAWRLIPFEVSKAEADLHNLRETLKSIDKRRVEVVGGIGRTIQAGHYWKLSEERHYGWDAEVRGSCEVPWMSDTPAERRDLYEPIMQADRRGGRVLVMGLGLGLVTGCLLELPKVEHVTVIERESDVVSLIAHHYFTRYGDRRLSVVIDDAYTWKPPRGSRYSVVWHDIWPTICGDNWREFLKLKAKYAHRAQWQGMWCQQETLRAKRLRW